MTEKHKNGSAIVTIKGFTFVKIREKPKKQDLIKNKKMGLGRGSEGRETSFEGYLGDSCSVSAKTAELIPHPLEGIAEAFSDALQR